MAVLVLFCLMLVMVLEASATRFIVGGNMGWTSNVNYTIWAQDKHFYNGDWLFFVYDRNQVNVLEVNHKDYVSCNADNFLHNWTTGAGRDVVPLNVTRHYYFISGKGFCYGGMKIAVKVESTPPPPSAAPVKSKTSAPLTPAPALRSQFALPPADAPVKSKTSDLTPALRSQVVLPALFAIGAMWDSFVWVW